MHALFDAVLVVLPVVLVVAVGNLFTRLRGFSNEQAQGLGKLCFWVCLPALTFREVVNAEPTRLFDWPLCGGHALVLLVIGFIGYRFARWKNAPPQHVGVIAQAAFRSNMLYVGLPVLIYHVETLLSRAATRETAASVAAIAAASAHAKALSAVTVSVAIPILNILSIVFFILPQRHLAGRKISAFKFGAMILANPLVLAVLLGLAVAQVPALKQYFAAGTVVGRTVELASAAALPLALLNVGAMIHPFRALKGWRQSVPVAFIKLVLMPALGLALFWQFGVRETPLAVGVIMLGCPTAATSQAMAAEMGGDDILASELIAVSTLLCPFTLVLWLSVLTSLGA